MFCKTSYLTIYCGRQRGRMIERKPKLTRDGPQASNGFGQTGGFLHTHEVTKNPGSVEFFVWRILLYNTSYPFHLKFGIFGYNLRLIFL
jgi:hypothetical protein